CVAASGAVGLAVADSQDAGGIGRAGICDGGGNGFLCPSDTHCARDTGRALECAVEVNVCPERGVKGVSGAKRAPGLRKKQIPRCARNDTGVEGMTRVQNSEWQE